MMREREINHLMKGNWLHRILNDMNNDKIVRIFLHNFLKLKGYYLRKRKVNYQKHKRQG